MRYLNPLMTLRRFEGARIFTEADAWMLFRIAAVGEAVVWTLLITGIAIRSYTGDGTMVTIGGRIHGMLFFAYLAASLVLYPSLGWSRFRALFALAFSVPPYGSLLFERWMSHRRQANGFRNYRSYLLYNALLTTTGRLA